MTTGRMQIILAAISIAAGAPACSSSSSQGGTGGASGAGGNGTGGAPGAAGAGGAGCPSASASVSCTPDLAWTTIPDGTDAGTSAGQPLAPDPTTGAYCATGAGIAVDFNAAGSSGRMKGIWDARSYGGVAFDFSGSSIPMHGMRVSFVFAGQGPDGPPWYQGTAQPYSAIDDGEHVVIHWDAIGGPYGAANPVLFDPSKLQTMQVQVLSGATTATPSQFCLTNLMALPD
jgi:hypothetical protein